MRHTTISGHHVGQRHTVAAAFWILAGIIVVIAVGDVLLLVAAALAIPTMVWRIDRRMEKNDARKAPVTHLRRALTGERHRTKPSAQGSWFGPSAA